MYTAPNTQGTQSYTEIDIYKRLRSTPSICIDGRVIMKAREVQAQGGDAVSISDAAKELAVLQGVSQEELEKMDYSPLDTFTTADGTKVSIEAAWHVTSSLEQAWASDNNGVTCIASRVTITMSNGTQSTLYLKDSAVITQAEDGTFQASTPKPGSNTLTGTDGDDIIITFPNYSRSSNLKIDAGNGNNTVFSFSHGTVDIKTGNGKDTIVTRGSMGFSTFNIDAGDGDDVVDVFGGNVTANLGNGNDSMTLDASAEFTIDGGNGDNVINVVESYFGSIKTGSGKDTVSVTGRGERINVATGDGDDSVFIDSVVNSHIDTGGGDDTVTTGKSAVFSGNISTGSGNDTVIMNHVIDSRVDTGDGDDTVTIESSGGSTLSTGNGNDSISIKYSGKNTISGGNGNDVINVVSDGGGSDSGSKIFGDNGDDQITLGNIYGGTVVDGGNGNDQISIDDAYEALINGGNGDDQILVEKDVSSKIEGGNGNDQITVGEDYTGIITGGNGNDKIIVKKAHASKVDGGNGDDEITVTISKEEAADTDTDARMTEVRGGNGNDKLHVDIEVLRAAGMDTLFDAINTVNENLKKKAEKDRLARKEEEKLEPVSAPEASEYEKEIANQAMGIGKRSEVVSPSVAEVPAADTMEDNAPAATLADAPSEWHAPGASASHDTGFVYGRKGAAAYFGRSQRAGGDQYSRNV